MPYAIMKTPHGVFRTAEATSEKKKQPRLTVVRSPFCVHKWVLWAVPHTLVRIILIWEALFLVIRSENCFAAVLSKTDWLRRNYTLRRSYIRKHVAQNGHLFSINKWVLWAASHILVCTIPIWGALFGTPERLPNDSVLEGRSMQNFYA